MLSGILKIIENSPPESKAQNLANIPVFLGSVSLFLNAPCHGWQVSKQAMDGLPEKTNRNLIYKPDRDCGGAQELSSGIP